MRGAAASSEGFATCEVAGLTEAGALRPLGALVGKSTFLRSTSPEGSCSKCDSILPLSTPWRLMPAGASCGAAWRFSEAASVPIGWLFAAMPGPCGMACWLLASPSCFSGCWLFCPPKLANFCWFASEASVAMPCWFLALPFWPSDWGLAATSSLGMACKLAAATESLALSAGSRHTYGVDDEMGSPCIHRCSILNPR